MILGFLGSGHLTAAIVSGMCATDTKEREILLSPRNEVIACGLAQRFTGVRVASNNDSLVRASDVVILAVRPGMAQEVLSPLSFEPGQLVISLMAKVPLPQVQALVRPATAVRALCMPTAARRQGSIILYPYSERAKQVLAPLGELLAVANETVLETLWAATGLVASQLELVNTVYLWLTAHGVSAPLADGFTKRLFAATMSQALDNDERLESQVAAAQTKGGLNEQALDELRAERVFEMVNATLDGVARRTAFTE